ncbi:MAG: substrate-binding domain-containing protein [Oscillospiraceae bacterium]
MKKLFSLFATGLLVFCTATAFSGCAKKGFDTKNEITVLSREEGSGTRGAFTELFKIEEKDASGNKVDKTIQSADITQSTGVMLTSIASNKNAIGYISLGSLNDTVKAAKIDGVAPSVSNVENGTYKISRPFNIATTEKISPVAKDFVDFILSTNGQEIVERNSYIAVAKTKGFEGTKPSGKITIAGSSSVSPVMQKLKEAYQLINPNATIELNQSDSTTGMNTVAEGVCDIGMASRELKDSELSKGLKSTTIALDGIAVILNKENTIENLTSEQVKKIYTIEGEKWADL